MRVYIGKDSDIGKRRTLNQDALSVDLRNGCFVVADGAGAHEGGEVASKIVVSNIEQFIANSKPGYEQRKNALIKAIESANLEIFKIAASQQKHGMCTTTTALLVSPGKYFIAHIGDSRAYLIRDGKIRQITKDHSYVQTLVDNGIITPLEARTHERRNEITRAVGFTSEIVIDHYEGEFRETDTFLLCSDGLWGEINDEEILDTVLNSDTPQDACNKLITLANNNGGNDNITVVIAQGSPTVRKSIRRKRSLPTKRFITQQTKKQLFKAGVALFIVLFISLIIIKVLPIRNKPEEIRIVIFTFPDTVNMKINKSQTCYTIIKNDSIWVSTGDTLEFSKFGYYKRNLVINDKERKKYTVNLKQIYVPLICSVFPTNASVLLVNNNRILANNDSLTFGLYRLKVDCPGYFPRETLLTIHDSIPIRFQMALKEKIIKPTPPPPEKGYLIFSGFTKDGQRNKKICGAEIWIGGKPTGKVVSSDNRGTRIENLNIGQKYKVEFKKNGELKYEMIVEVNPAPNKRKYFAPSP